MMRWVLLVCVIAIVSCDSQKIDQQDVPAKEALNPIEVSVDKLLESNGGFEKWNDVTELSFTKKTRMFLPDSSIEMESLQRQTFRNYPSFYGEIQYLEDSLKRRITQDGYEVKYYENGKEVKDADKVKKAATSIQVAYYVIALPFKLKDDGVNFRELKVDTMLGEGLARELHVVHDSHPDQNWWLYFDQDDDYMKGYLIEHDDRFSYIVNDETKQLGKFRMPVKRRSIALDNEFKNPYLRADYEYSEIKVTTD